MALVLLHGFAGDGRSWDAVRAHLPGAPAPYTPDLRGHGHSAAVRPVTWHAVVEEVARQISSARSCCVGYSMGARVALAVALAVPEAVERLVLLAGTAGIEDEAERAARRTADEALAAWLEDRPIAAFADRWAALPLWDGDPPAVRAAQREDVLRQDPAGLAAALRGLGTGTMPPLWDRLGELGMPVDVVVGERDRKFCALGERLRDALPHGRLHVVPGAGHGLAREAPATVAALLAG
jgi:2-succinyl-6-hydroxy-2,4-cyclohexadiene-1-carboxylate synthase